MLPSPLLLVLLTEHNVVSQRGVQDPGLLRHVGQPPSERHTAFQHPHLLEQDQGQRSTRTRQEDQKPEV